LSPRAARALGVFLLQAAVGLRFLAPSVSFGDSGELIASAATLSIPHAPGYPLFCLAARAVSELFPFAEWAWRVNLFSALCGAAALAVLFDALALCGLSALPSLAGVFFLGLSPVWLRSSLTTEVFALHWLLASLCFWTACRWKDIFAGRPIALMGLILGRGGANHQTLLLAVPPLLASAWLEARPSAERLIKGAALLLLFGLLGLAAYAYLPIRAGASPPLDWGHPADLPRFLHVLLRRDFGTLSLTVEGPGSGRLAGLLAQALRYARSTWDAFGPSGCALALLGAAASYREGLRWKLPALLLFCAGPGFLWLGNPPLDAMTEGALERFYPLSWLGFPFFIACGAAAAARPLRAMAPAALCVIAALPGLSAALRAPSWSQRWDLAPYDYGLNLLRSVPKGAALFLDGGDDSFFTLAYTQFALGLRPDVEVHDRGALVFRNPYGPDFRLLPKPEKEARRVQVEALVAARRPLYYSTLRDSILPGRKLMLEGILRSVGGREDALPFETPRGRALWETLPVRISRPAARAFYRYRALVAFYPLMRALAWSERGRGAAALRALEEAADLGPDVVWLPEAASQAAQWTAYQAGRTGDWRTAEAAYRSALDFTPRSAEVRLNIAVSMEKQGRLEEAEGLYLAIVREAPGPDAWYNLGSMYWSSKRWKEAAAAFTEASALKPGDARLSGYRNESLRRSGARR
jgi:hypothetical protein